MGHVSRLFTPRGDLSFYQYASFCIPGVLLRIGFLFSWVNFSRSDEWRQAEASRRQTDKIIPNNHNSKHSFYFGEIPQNI